MTRVIDVQAHLLPSIAIASIVFGGVFDRLPGLRLGFAHGGGYGVFGSGRFDHGTRIRPELDVVDLPSVYMRRMWFDCLAHDELALKFLVERVGSDRIVLGTDDPADMGLDQPVAWLEACPSLSPEQRTSMLATNPAEWLDLGPDGSWARRSDEGSACGRHSSRPHDPDQSDSGRSIGEGFER